MSQGRFRERLGAETSGFLLVSELVGGPGFNYGPVEGFLKGYQQAAEGWEPEGFEFVGVTWPQSPGGVANIDPADAAGFLREKGLLGELDFLAHVSCKDWNTDAIKAGLAGFKRLGVESVLALTGDKPAGAKGVFEVDSIGLLGLINEVNRDAYRRSKVDDLGKVHQFFAGAAVSPFKYTEAGQMQQYYKMEKKASRGAKFFITQVGWDWRKSAELFRYMEENRIEVPVIGNVYLLSSITPAPRLMHDIVLPGCFVSDDLFKKVMSEGLDAHIERAAQQVAMYKSLGAAGVDIGGVHDFEMFSRIVTRAAEIGKEWEQFKDNLCWPLENGFYLYDEQGRRTTLSRKRCKFAQRAFNVSHRAMLDPDYHGFGLFKKALSAVRADRQGSVTNKLFTSVEKPLKYLLFDCECCGDCYLPENFGFCTIGRCEKGLNNAPCGDSTADGRCGNNLDRVCIGELIYEAAAAQDNGLAKLRDTINKGRNPALEQTSSIVNYLFGRDHTMKSELINIGEAVHASIPKTGKVMAKLAEHGEDAYSNPSPELEYIRMLIESQVDEGADFIEVNLDAFGEDDPQVSVEMMKEYVNLVRKWGKGVPMCVDSSDDNVLEAGLRQWYDTAEKVKLPLLNSVKTYTADHILPLKKEFDFDFIALLVTEGRPSGPGGSHSVDELYGLAKEIFEKAMQYGFRPEQIYFDSTVFPLAIDMPMEPGVPGYTYRAFETIRKIKNDPAMKGVHCSLGVSNAVRDLPGRRIGVCRAYVAVAQRYGLDAGIVNTAHGYGTKEPDPQLVKLVEAFAAMDGSAEKQNRAMQLMGRFCQENRKFVK